MRLPTGSELWPIAIFTVIFLLLVDLMHRRQRWTSRYPPGPVPWPVLGNLLQIDFQNMPAGFQKVWSSRGMDLPGVSSGASLCPPSVTLAWARSHWSSG